LWILELDRLPGSDGLTRPGELTVQFTPAIGDFDGQVLTRPTGIAVVADVQDWPVHCRIQADLLER
jgi:hypothetical protein